LRSSIKASRVAQIIVPSFRRDWTEFIEVSRRGFHVALGQFGLTITHLMATIKRAISPEMNDTPPMNTPAITSFGLGQLPPHAQ
jgi:hypothetical protein